MRKLETAEAVICHGGSGTILDAIRCGHVPIIMPRLAIHREHVDDHQLQIAERLQQEGKAFALTSFDLLESLLTIAKERKGQRVLDAPNALQDALVSTSERLCRNRVASRLRWVALRALTRWLPLPPRSD